jgi:hypothetical protein
MTWMVLFFVFLGTLVGTCVRALRGPSARSLSRDRELLSRLAGWMLSPLLHAGLAVLAALSAIREFPERDLRSPRAWSSPAWVVPGEGPRLDSVREPDLPRYGRLTSQTPTSEGSSEEFEAPVLPAEAAERFLLEPAAAPVETAQDSPPGRAASGWNRSPELLSPSALEHASGSGRAGHLEESVRRAHDFAPAPALGEGWPGAVSLRRTPAGQRGPATPAARLPGIRNPSASRATPSPGMRRRSTALAAPSWSRMPGDPWWGARTVPAVQSRTTLRGRMATSAWNSAAPGFAARAKLAAAPGVAVLRAPEAQRRAPNPAALDGTEIRPVHLLPNGGLNGTSIRAASGSINGTDIRNRR